MKTIYCIPVNAASLKTILASQVTDKKKCVIPQKHTSNKHKANHEKF